MMRARRAGFVADVEQASRMSYAQYLLAFPLVDAPRLGVRELADAQRWMAGVLCVREDRHRGPDGHPAARRARRGGARRPRAERH